MNLAASFTTYRRCVANDGCVISLELVSLSFSTRVRPGDGLARVRHLCVRERMHPRPRDDAREVHLCPGVRTEQRAHIRRTLCRRRRAAVRRAPVSISLDAISRCHPRRRLRRAKPRRLHERTDGGFERTVNDDDPAGPQRSDGGARTSPTPRNERLPRPGGRREPRRGYEPPRRERGLRM